MDDRIADLLEKWEEAADEGKELPVEELCRECPECVEELRWRITALKRTSWTRKPLTDEPIQGTKPADFGLPETLGRYFLETLLGTGGFGQVWRAFDPQLKRHVAVKIPRRDKLAAPEHFLAEAQKVARLRHPGIVSVHDVGSQDGVFYIVSEFIEVGSLADQLAKGTPWRTETLTLIADVADALQHAHERGFVHRDIKPSNILVDEHGKPFLADFGIAVTNQETQASSLGTLPYMAPEQLAEGKADARTDIYSLGVVLYQLLTGRLPFDSADPGELRQWILTGPLEDGSGVTGELLAICKKCLAKNPADRFTTANDLSTALRAALGGKRGTRWSARIAAGLLLILVIVVGSFAVWHFTGQPDENKKNDPITRNKKPDDEPKTKEVRKYEGHKDKVTCLALSPGGKSFVTGSADRTVRVWNLKTGEAQVIEQPAEVTAVALSSDQKKLACGCSTGVVRLIDIADAEPKGLHSFKQQTKPITALTFSPQGRYLFAGSKDGSFLSWNLSVDPPRMVPWPKPEGVPATACFMKKDILAVGIGSEPEKPGRFWHWRVDEAKGNVDPLLTPVINGTSSVTAVGFSPDLLWVLSACQPDGISVWKLTPDSKEVKAAGVFQGHVGRVNGIAVSHDTQLVASAGADGTVRVWSLGTQEELHRFDGHTGPVNAVVFLPDGRHVLSAGDDGIVRLWWVEVTK